LALMVAIIKNRRDIAKSLGSVIVFYRVLRLYIIELLHFTAFCGYTL